MITRHSDGCSGVCCCWLLFALQITEKKGAKTAIDRSSNGHHNEATQIAVQRPERHLDCGSTLLSAFPGLFSRASLSLRRVSPRPLPPPLLSRRARSRVSVCAFVVVRRVGSPRRQGVEGERKRRQTGLLSDAAAAQ